MPTHNDETLLERYQREALDFERMAAEANKSERRAIEYGDIVHRHVLVMRAAVVAWQREGAEAGMLWIANTLFGPGHLPSDADIAMGAQALFDKETAEHEAFRAAHPVVQRLPADDTEGGRGMSFMGKLSRQERRAADAYLRAENLNWPEALKLWPAEEWPAHMRGAKGVLRVYRSRGFLVQVFAEPDPVVVRLSILRTAIKTNGDWKEDITWEELQRLKQEAGYGDFDAVEVYPPDADVVNVANLRHLWILPAGYLPFAWRRKV